MEENGEWTLFFFIEQHCTWSYKMSFSEELCTGRGDSTSFAAVFFRGFIWIFVGKKLLVQSNLGQTGRSTHFIAGKIIDGKSDQYVIWYWVRESQTLHRQVPFPLKIISGGRMFIYASVHLRRSESNASCLLRKANKKKMKSRKKKKREKKNKDPLIARSFCTHSTQFILDFRGQRTTRAHITGLECGLSHTTPSSLLKFATDLILLFFFLSP